MENKITIFENNEFGRVRTTFINEEPWFVGKDVAEILGYSNPRKALIDHVDSNDKIDGVTIRDSMGRNQKPIFINESGLYSLILSSKLPKAKEFKRWVTSEVLPSIRKYGSFFVDIPKTLPECLVAYANEIKAHEETKRELAIAKPKAEFYDTVANTESLLSVGDTAKLLDMGVGRNNLFKFLKEHKILMKDNMPYQQYVDRGYFKVVENYYMAGDNKIVAKTTYVKQKGVDFIRKLLGKEDKE